MATEPLSEHQANLFWRLVCVVLDLTAQLDGLKGLPIGLEEIEAQAMHEGKRRARARRDANPL